MNKAIPVIISIIAAVLAAGAILVIVLRRDGGEVGWIIYMLIGIGGALAAIALGIAHKLPPGGKSEAAPEGKKTQPVAWVVIAALAAQTPIFTDIIRKASGREDPMLVMIAVVVFTIIAVTAVIVITRKRAPTASSRAQTPLVVPLIIGLMVLSVGGIAFGIHSSAKPVQSNADPIWLFLAMGVTLAVFIFVLRLIITGTRASAYALPDVLPAAGPPTDPRLHRSGYYDGTKLLNQRVWGMPVQVMGRGYFIRGHGKAWLADEVLAFHLYMTRNPLVIPYGIIHGVKTKNLILVKNRLPGPGMSIIWGRPDLPMVTTIQVTQNKAENELWAQEIMRRAGVWKEKMAATQGDATAG